MPRRADHLRLLLAGAAAVLGIFAIIALVSRYFPRLPLWMIPILLLAFAIVTVGMLYLFNVGNKLPRGRTNADLIQELEAKGLLASAAYTATRAFAVAEFEDEGPHYFLELSGGGVLYLTGQYLYEYEPAKDQPRRFPCTAFTVCWDQEKGYTVGIVCHGDVLEPELNAPAFGLEDLMNVELWEDRNVFREKSYEEIKAERMKLK